MEHSGEVGFGAALALGGLALNRWIEPNLALRAVATSAGLGGAALCALGAERRLEKKRITALFAGALGVTLVATAFQILKREIPLLSAALASKDLAASLEACGWVALCVTVLLPSSAVLLVGSSLQWRGATPDVIAATDSAALKAQLQELISKGDGPSIVAAVRQLKIAAQQEVWQDLLVTQLSDYPIIEKFDADEFDTADRVLEWSDEKLSKAALNLWKQLAALKEAMSSIKGWEAILTEGNQKQISVCSDLFGQLVQAQKKHKHSIEQLNNWLLATDKAHQRLSGDDAGEMLFGYILDQRSYPLWEGVLGQGTLKHLQEDLEGIGLPSEATLMHHRIIPQENETRIDEAEVLRRLQRYIQGLRTNQ